MSFGLRTVLAGFILSASCSGDTQVPNAPDALDDAVESAITANAHLDDVLTTTRETRLRAGPGTLYDALDTIPDGAHVKGAKRGAPTDHFYRVTFGGKTGWVYGPYLRSSTAVWGYYPDARDALLQLGVTSSRVMQTIGDADASAGTHAQDGTANGTAYCAATDVSVYGLTEAQIRSLLESLGRRGIAGWYRKPGADGWPSTESPHLHVIYAGAPMKWELRAQLDDWLAGRNGLTSHLTYGFYRWSDTAKNAVRRELGLLQAPEGPDADGDGVLDLVDNCPRDRNAAQEDTDHDHRGDACDHDNDNDGVGDDRDNCPNTRNAGQSDVDGDGKGDACDGDLDGDGDANDRDNCPRVENPGQLDTDGDGRGDRCEEDDDGDGVKDASDNCATEPNAAQADLDHDGKGDACDGDVDGDGLADEKDDCPGLADPGQDDLDGDGIGDACDADRDDDGVKNVTDNCPDVPNTSQADADADGTGDDCDDFVVPDDQQQVDATNVPAPPVDEDPPVIKVDPVDDGGCHAVPGHFCGLLLALTWRGRRRTGSRVPPRLGGK